MKKIVYKSGPARISVGQAGQFNIGVPRELDDGLADRLLKKNSIRFVQVTEPKAVKE